MTFKDRIEDLTQKIVIGSTVPDDDGSTALLFDDPPGSPHVRRGDGLLLLHGATGCAGGLDREERLVAGMELFEAVRPCGHTISHFMVSMASTALRMAIRKNTW